MKISFDKLTGKSGPREPAAPWSLVTVVPACFTGMKVLAVVGPAPEMGRLEPSLPGWPVAPSPPGQALAGGGASCALLPAGLACVRLVVNLGYRGLDSRLRGNDGSGFPARLSGGKLFSGQFRPFPVMGCSFDRLSPSTSSGERLATGSALRQAQDERLARMAGGCPAAGGGYGRMGGVLLGIGIAGAIPDWLCYDSNDSRTSITHGLRAVKILGKFWEIS